MSSPSIALAVPISQTTEAVRVVERVTEAEDLLLRRGFQFYVSHRLDLARWSRWKGLLYQYFCREAHPNLRVPPVVPETRGGLLSFAHADTECTSMDDQLHIIPFGWLWKAKEAKPSITCRPRDPQDTARYSRLKSIFGEANSGDVVMELAAQVCTLRQQLERMKSNVREGRAANDCLDAINERFKRMFDDLSSS